VIKKERKKKGTMVIVEVRILKNLFLSQIIHFTAISVLYSLHAY